ncbi:MAG: SAM-dependent methyltransferase, partial [Rhodospirillaceae bacterium]
LAFPFAEQPFPDLLIERTLTREQLLDYVETWSATKYARAAGQQVLLERFVEDLNQLWPDPKVPQDINWPIVGRIGPVHSD